MLGDEFSVISAAARWIRPMKVLVSPSPSVNVIATAAKDAISPRRTRAGRSRAFRCRTEECSLSAARSCVRATPVLSRPAGAPATSAIFQPGCSARRFH